MTPGGSATGVPAVGSAISGTPVGIPVGGSVIGGAYGPLTPPVPPTKSDDMNTGTRRVRCKGRGEGGADGGAGTEARGGAPGNMGTLAPGRLYSGIMQNRNIVNLFIYLPNYI